MIVAVYFMFKEWSGDRFLLDEAPDAVVKKINLLDIQWQNSIEFYRWLKFFRRSAFYPPINVRTAYR